MIRRLLGLLFLSSIASAQTVDTRPAVIYIPGYFGSALRDPATGRRVFVTVTQALAHSEALSLFQDELQTPKGPAVEVEGLLDFVTVIPGVYEIDVYGGFFEDLRKIPGTQVIPFAYDWRKDLHDDVVELAALIDRLRNSGVPRIDIVAHSLGTLIASYYLAYGTQQPETARLTWEGARTIRKFVSMGAPFDGSFVFVRDMNRGNQMPMMGSLLPAETMSSFPSAYFAIPYRAAHVLDFAGQPSPLRLADVALWKTNGLGLFARTDLATDILERRSAFTEKWLARGFSFMNRLQFPSAPTPPADLGVLAIIGHGHSTIDTAFADFSRGPGDFVFDCDRPSRRKLDPKSLGTDGDGMVSLASSRLPAAFQDRAEIISTTVSHEKMVTDRALKARVIEFLRR